MMKDAMSESRDKPVREEKKDPQEQKTQPNRPLHALWLIMTHISSFIASHVPNPKTG